MKKLIIPLFLLTAILFSCATTSSAPQIMTEAALQSGHIMFNSKDATTSDIVCLGKFHPNQLRLTQIPLTNLIPSWWKGTMSVAGTEKEELEISYLVTHDSTTGKPAEMNYIKVKGFDDSFSFPEMTIREPTFSSIVKKDLPYTFTEFSLDGEPFLLQMTTMDEPLIKTQYAPTTLFGLWRYKNQIFSIVGKNDGERYAEFTVDSYAIQKMPATTSVEKLCYAIGVFSVIQRATDRIN